MWRELVEDFGSQATPGEPAPQGAVENAEERLRQALPGELRALLLEMNGVTGRHGLGITWTAERIAKENEEFRSNADFADLYAPFDSLLFFGDNGGGDQFAYRMDSWQPEIHVWDHETDERNAVAASMREYLVRSLRSGGEDWYR